MPSEIREKPLPTPHPDHSPAPAGEGGRGHGQELEKTQEFDSEDVVWDSVVDDLDLKLGEAIGEPDPALNSTDPGGTRRQASGGGSSFPDEKRDQPGTSELFGAVEPPLRELAPRRGGWNIRRLFSRVLRGEAGSNPVGSRGGGEAIPAPHRLSESRRVDSGSDDEIGTDGRGTWLTFVLLSYASAVTLGLAWVLWMGRMTRPAAEEPAPKAALAADVRALRAGEGDARIELPPIPAQNVASVGRSIRIGDVEITPLGVALAPVELIRTIEPADYRLEEVNSLVLRIQLTNRSREHTFQPLARRLIRDAASQLDRSFVEVPGGGRIDLYPLAVESEWLIIGQEFPALKPGESVTTLVASEPVTEDRLRGEMTWRVRLRIGPYRTDILGVRFTRNELLADSSAMIFNGFPNEPRRLGKLACRAGRWRALRSWQ